MPNNPNIQTEPTPPKTRAKSQNLEGKIQASIVKWFGETYPDRRGSLIAYFANPENKAQGGVMLSMGLMKDVSDLLYMYDGAIFGIEVKSEGTYHNVEHLRGQANWILKNCRGGCFVDSLSQFKGFFDDTDGTTPETVLQNLKNIKTKTVLWDVAKKPLSL